MNILDQFARAQAPVRPQTMDEAFGTRLAQKLGDAAAVAHYVHLLSEHRREKVLAAYGRALESAHKFPTVAEAFHRKLADGNNRQHPAASGRLAAIKVERRSIAAAVFDGEFLEYHEVRHLSSNEPRATASAAGFLNWIIANFHIESTALEVINYGPTNRRIVLSTAIREVCRKNGIPIWQISKQELLNSFGYPPLRSRKDLRQILRSIWPILNDSRGNEQVLDAAALGVYVQIERLFIN